MPPPSSPPTPFPTSFREQAISVFANPGACLALGGAKPRDVTKITIHVVGLGPEMKSDLVGTITDFFTVDGKQHKPPSTLLGVAALARKDFLIGVDATAVVAV